MMNWDEYRRENGTIHLAKAAIDQAPFCVPDKQAMLIDAFLNAVEKLQPIVSRQAAALAITTAYWVCKERL